MLCSEANGVRRLDCEACDGTGLFRAAHVPIAKAGAFPDSVWRLVDQKGKDARGMRITAACLMALLITTGVARAQMAAIAGVGVGISCGDWITERHKAGWHSSWSTLEAQQWILGFLSGVGWANTPNENPLERTDAKGVWAWVDNYCQAHPLNHLVDAGPAFVREHRR